MYLTYTVIERSTKLNRNGFGIPLLIEFNACYYKKEDNKFRIFLHDNTEEFINFLSQVIDKKSASWSDKDSIVFGFNNSEQNKIGVISDFVEGTMYFINSSFMKCMVDIMSEFIEPGDITKDLFQIIIYNIYEINEFNSIYDISYEGNVISFIITNEEKISEILPVFNKYLVGFNAKKEKGLCYISPWRHEI